MIRVLAAEAMAAPLAGTGEHPAAAPDQAAASASQHQTCKACGKRDKFDFHIPDDVWRAIVPPHLQTRVVCLDCFDGFAASAGVGYADHLEAEFHFVGDAATLIFTIARRINP